MCDCQFRVHPGAKCGSDECQCHHIQPEVDFQVKAQSIVVGYFNSNLLDATTAMIVEGDVYVVWFSKTLQNWKALLSTTIGDGMYYEVTYNGDKKESYLDAYTKVDNVRVPD